MRFTIIAAAAFSTAVFAASGTPIPPLSPHTLLTHHPVKRDPQTDVASILAALRENNPEDADAAASAMKIKIRSAEPQDDLNSILADLRTNNPDDAAAAESAVSKREAQDDLNSILAALSENNPDDADAARANVQKRQDDLSAILSALGENNPDDAAAAAGLNKRWL